MANRLRIDWIQEPPIILPVGATSANVQLAEPTAPNQTFFAGDRGFFWLMGVSGTAAYLNWGTTSAVVATATNANVLHPVGRDDTPKSYPVGIWVAAIAPSGGSGQVFFIRCYPIGV